MHDMLPQPQGDASGALADVGVTPSELKAALSAVLSEFAWQLEQITLSRRGLAGIVELIGSTDHARSPGDAAALRSEAIAAEGNAILSHVLGSADRSRARSARLPSGGLAWGDGRSSAARLGGDRHGRARRPRAPRPGRSPEHPAAARTPEPRSPPADLADILRRGCGAGPYAPAKLRRVVRQSIARAAHFPARSALGWYLQFMLVRPLWRPLRAFLVRALLARPAASDG